MILIYFLGANPVKECHDSNCRSNARACGKQVQQKTKVPESRLDHTFESRLDHTLGEKRHVVEVDVKIRSHI